MKNWGAQLINLNKNIRKKIFFQCNINIKKQKMCNLW